MLFLNPLRNSFQGSLLRLLPDYFIGALMGAVYAAVSEAVVKEPNRARRLINRNVVAARGSLRAAGPSRA